MIKSVSFIGCGNVAYNLANQFTQIGVPINLVFSKNNGNSDNFAKQFNARQALAIEEFNQLDDLVIIAINDDQIVQISKQLKNSKALVAHTSGSVSMEVMNSISNHGVFYPLQTFTKEKLVEFNNIPICIEANTKQNELLLMKLANSFSSNVQIISSSQRQQIHLAAVFACNFTNHFYHIASELMESSNMDFSLLHPLILESASKIKNHSPLSIQTGPAVRNDQLTINKHLELLKDHPKYQNLYNLVTQSIQTHED